MRPNTAEPGEEPNSPSIRFRLFAVWLTASEKEGAVFQEWNDTPCSGRDVQQLTPHPYWVCPAKVVLDSPVFYPRKSLKGRLLAYIDRACAWSSLA